MACFHKETQSQVNCRVGTWTSGSGMQTGSKLVWEGTSTWSRIEAVPPSGSSSSRLCTSAYYAFVNLVSVSPPSDLIDWTADLQAPDNICTRQTMVKRGLGDENMESMLYFESSASLQTWIFPPTSLVITTIFPSKTKFPTTYTAELDRETQPVPVADGIPTWVLFLSEPVQYCAIKEKIYSVLLLIQRS